MKMVLMMLALIAAFGLFGEGMRHVTLPAHGEWMLMLLGFDMLGAVSRPRRNPLDIR